jgi:hypothetical protein
MGRPTWLSSQAPDHPHLVIFRPYLGNGLGRFSKESGILLASQRVIMVLATNGTVAGA